MLRKTLRNGLFWGFIVWLIGYILGILLFPFVPNSFLGWVITPIGIVVAVLILYKKIKGTSITDYLLVSIIWTLLAIILDYFLLVQVFKPADGYYKFDVYVYYITTFILPLLIGFIKLKKNKK